MIHKAQLWLAIGLAASSACSPAPVGDALDWLQAAKAKTYKAADRVGHACCTIWLIPGTADKDAFNAQTPADDIARFKTTVRDRISALRDQVAALDGIGPADGAVDADEATGLMIPDVLTLKLSEQSTYPNGRYLTNAATDAVIAQIFDRSSWSDGVQNSYEPLSEFPFLSAPEDPKD